MKIEFKNQKPKYIELFEIISKQINDGDLKGGDKLPSKRDLAIDLNVSLNTIMNAYNLLLEEGYIYSLEKIGYFVEKQSIVNKRPTTSFISSPIENKYTYDFTTQNVEEFTNSNWRRIIRKHITLNEFLNKTPQFGDLGLRSSIASHLRENRGIEVSPDSIIIGSGLEMLEHILLSTDIQTLTLENPGYHKLSKIASNLGFIVKYQPLDDQGVLIPQGRTILYTTPFNQFPTGIKMSISRKKELIQFAEKTNSYIIEDDFDAEFRINSNPQTSMFTLNRDHVIFFSTFTETIYPGLRISYAILPKSLLESYSILYKEYSTQVPTLEQITLRDFIIDGYYESHINKAKRKYIQKRSLILEELKEDKRFSIDTKKNYLSILIHVNLDYKDIEIKQMLEENGIKIQMLSDLDITKEDSKTIILGYTAISIDKIKEGLKAIKESIK